MPSQTLVIGTTSTLSGTLVAMPAHPGNTSSTSGHGFSYENTDSAPKTVASTWTRQLSESTLLPHLLVASMVWAVVLAGALLYLLWNS